MQHDSYLEKEMQGKLVQLDPSLENFGHEN